jgi:hypothetical protein
MRTRSGALVGQTAVWRRRWVSTAAEAASSGRRNAAENASPAVENT